MSRRKTKLSPGTWLERKMFESQAYLSLRGFAPQLLSLMLGKRQFDKMGKKGREQRVCLNCDSLSFTYVEAEKKYGITKTRLARAFDELLAKGFLTCRHHGGGYKQDKSIYALAEKWEFWAPGSTFEKREKDTVQRGFCKPKGAEKVVRGSFG